MNDDVLPAAPPRSRLAGVNHIAIMTPDLERLIRFYERVFGATPGVPSDNQPWKCSLEIAPGTVFHLFEVPAAIARQPDDLPFDQGSINHFALEARDAEAFLQIRALLIAGSHADESVFESPGTFSLFAVDPDGLFIEVTLVRPSDWTPPFKTTAFVPHDAERGSMPP
jgi:catechol 2,3-dioxygenase-like lactoylglutathione lyase family enzyme